MPTLPSASDTEKALRLSEQKYRELVENANSIILRWLPDGTVTFLNEFGQKFFGYSQTEILGRHVMDTIVPNQQTNGRDLSRMIDEICRDPRSFEHNTNENMRRGGERVWIDWTNKVVAAEDGRIKEILSIGTDVTEKKRAQEQLRISEEKFRNIFEGAPIGIFQTTAEGDLISANPAGLQLFGYASMEEAMANVPNISALYVRPEARTALLHALGLTGSYVQQEVEFRRRDHSTFFGNIYLRMVRAPAGSPHLEGFIEDITNRKRTEEELAKHREHLEDLVEQRTAELAIAKDKAESADRLKSVFLASMSHELRTPLNSIIGFTGMTLKGDSGALNDEQKDNLSRVYRSAKHLLSLITDIIDISKIEAGRIDVTTQTFSVQEMLSEITSMVQELLQDKRLAFQVDVPEGLTMHTDRKRLLQSVLNLVSNAIKYTEQGGVSVGVTEGNGMVEFAVADTGIGISPADMPKLFESFRRFESPLSVKAGGTGLGLYLTKKLVSDLLQGSISAESVLGKGSVFRIRAPKELVVSRPSL
jgi:PAS domain S-box-containing protein